MKTVDKTLFVFLVACTMACSSRKAKAPEQDMPFPVKYENELFSINVPKGWMVDDSKWEGLNHVENTVDIFDPNGNVVCFHIVKTFFPFRWKNIEEATKMAKGARGLSMQDFELWDEVDSVEVGGYPASILCFANFVDNDTLIQKQYVVYMQDSHIVIYFNENFYIQDWDEAQDLGDMIINTVKLKNVMNPLDNDSIMRKVIADELNNQ